jgi:hypothetical protein
MTAPRALLIPDERLPLWMRRARRGFDYGILISLLLGVMAASAFIITPGLPRTNFAEHYVFQTADFSSALQEGRLWIRWSPHAFGGYGAPIPHFHPPAPAYFAAILSTFVADYEVTAVRVAFIISLCMASCAMYVLVLRTHNATAGVLASALYVFCPAISLIAAQRQGDLSIVMAAALLPALLWAVDRLLSSDRPHDVLITGLITAALCLTHIPLSVTGLILASSYIVWRAARGKIGTRWQHTFLALTMGILMAAPFWLPAYAERESVRWLPAEQPAGTLSLNDLFTLPRSTPPDALLPETSYTIGFVIPALVIASAVWSVRSCQRHTLSFAAACLFALGILGILILREIPVWLSVPLALAGAVGSTSVIGWSRRASVRIQNLLLPALLIFIVLSSLPLFAYTVTDEVMWDISPAAQVQYELNGYGIAVLPPNQPTPTSLGEAASLSPALTSGYLRGEMLNLYADPAEITVQISGLAMRSHSDSYQVVTLSGGPLRVLIAAFPGWTATLNGARIDLQTDERTGLMSVILPGSTTGELTFSLDSTPIRTFSWMVAWSALAALMGLWIRRRMRHPSSEDEFHTLLPPAESRLTLITAAGIAGMIALIWLSGGAAITSPSAPAAAFSYRSRTNSGLEMLGFDLARARYQPGETIEVDLYLRTLRSLNQNYRLRAHLIDLSTGIRIAPLAAHHPGGYPTRRWTPGRYVRDRLRFTLPEDLTPTTLALAIEIGNCQPDCDSDARLAFFNPEGAALGDRLVLPVELHIGL